MSLYLVTYSNIILSRDGTGRSVAGWSIVNGCGWLSDLRMSACQSVSSRVHRRRLLENTVGATATSYLTLLSPFSSLSLLSPLFPSSHRLNPAIRHPASEDCGVLSDAVR